MLWGDAMKKRIRSYFDAKARELRETDPDGIQVVKVGPPFEVLLYDVQRLKPKPCLTTSFDLRKYLAKDKSRLHKSIESELIATARRLFGCQPIVPPDQLAAARLLAAIGPEWALHVAHYPPALHARILFLADRVPRFRQLVLTYPGLATDALRSAVRACGKHLIGAAEYLTPLLRGNARDIAAELDWPSGTAGILQRLWLPAASFAAVDALKWRLTADDAAGRRARRVLPHCSHITRDAVRVVCNNAAFERVENSAVVELCSQPPDEFRVGTGDWDMLAQLLHAEARFPRLRVRDIRSRAQLQRIYGRHFGGLYPYEVNGLLDRDFPPPPFGSDDPAFQHIEDPLSALAEAVEMGPNCIADLIPRVADRELHIFRILPDAERQIERATLVISEHHVGHDYSIWALYDARTRRNGPISQTTEKAINDFLRRNQ